MKLKKERVEKERIEKVQLEKERVEKEHLEKGQLKKGRLKKKKLQQFILNRILMMIAAVFLLIFISLNLFFRVNIVMGARNQLEKLVEDMENLAEEEGFFNAGQERDTQKEEADWQFTATGERVLKGNVFVISDKLELLDILHGTSEAANEIIACLKKYREESIQNIRNLHVRGESRNYYISVSPDLLQEDAWMVYYVDVTETVRFYGAVSAALLVILFIGIGISWALTYRMTRQLSFMVEELSGYADEIGSGNYQIEKPVFSVREMDGLALSMRKMAEKIDYMQKQQKVFFQNVSHELRTPLMSIRCYGEGIKYGVMSPKESSETILTETEKLSDMVEDILYLSRLESKTLDERKVQTDLREVLSMCALSQKKQAEGKGICYEFQFDDEPVELLCREEDIKRMCNNLISNAIRYAKGRILLECQNTAEGRKIAVADDGNGILEEDMPYLFERFYKGKDGIHGIGLSIVASVANLYGAKIHVANEEGARFEILFIDKKTE